MLRGTAHFLTRGGARSLEVETPFSVAGVRGTEFQVEVGADQTLVSVLEGNVHTSNAAGELSVASGQAALARQGEPPRPELIAQPRGGGSWALYSPPAPYVQPGARAGDPAWLEQTRRSSEAYLRGDLSQAFQQIEGVTGPDASDPGFLTYRASLHLAVGGVKEAEADLAQALSRAPEHAGALALQSVLAVVADQRESALDLAQRAVAAGPREAAPRIALSYARPAQFDLAGARRALEEAVEVQPEDALAWARLAEIRSSQGDLDGALAAADRAAELAPDLSRTQTVRGFALLSRVEPEAAQSVFERAIALDS